MSWVSCLINIPFLYKSHPPPATYRISPFFAVEGQDRKGPLGPAAVGADPDRVGPPMAGHRQRHPQEAIQAHVHPGHRGTAWRQAHGGEGGHLLLFFFFFFFFCKRGLEHVSITYSFDVDFANLGIFFFEKYPFDRNIRRFKISYEILKKLKFS